MDLCLQNANGTGHHYRFDLRKLKPGSSQRVVAEYGASLAEPQSVEKPGKSPGLGNVAIWLVIGDWGGGAVDVVLSEIALVPPTAELRQRAKLKAIKAEEAEAARQAAEAKKNARKALLKKGASHPADGPEVTYVCAVAANVLCITLQAGRHVNNRLVDYVAEPGDEIVQEEKDKPRHAPRDGKAVDYFSTALFRNANHNRTKAGLLSPDGKQLFIESSTAGQLLDETVVDVPAAYTIQSADDPAYAAPLTPTAVFRKGKPNGFSRPLPFLYTISLRLPSPLKQNAAYTLRFVGVNTSQPSVSYVHKPRQQRSLAVHAIQTGYRPDDPYKRAYLSFWMGADQQGRSGSCTPATETFELLDDAGRTVFTGKAALAKPDGAEEQICIHEKLDYTKAAVYRLDFSAFRTPGTYRVYVPDIGLSGPFRVAADVWETPFRAAMQGILSQRQGIDLGPPACAFVRKRTFHPDDGVQFYQMDIPVQAGQEGTRGENLVELAKAGRLRRVSGVWGGYQDAGDWDSLGGHLSATYDLLGLYDLNPAAFSRMKLSLPAEDLQNNLPHILDEALWQMSLWRRLQLADGGVRGGYGVGWDCYAGETSSMQKYAGVYAVDHVTTMHFAAAAARAARVLAAYDKELSAEYLESARRAWAWVEAHAKDDDAIFKRVLSFDKDLPKNLRDKRAMAAVELLAVTLDPIYDRAFHESSELSGKAGLYLDQLEADFAYARLPVSVGDPKLKQRAVERIAAYADHAIAFSRRNAYDIIAGRGPTTR